MLFVRTISSMPHSIHHVIRLLVAPPKMTPLLLFLLCLATSASLRPFSGPAVMQLEDSNDICADGNLIPNLSFNCSFVIDDPRFINDSHSQCRSLCQESVPSFLHAFRISANCSFCTTKEAQKYNFKEFSEDHFCIPRHRCIASCGAEPSGCLYSGSCASLFCFEGAQSRKTAQVTRFTHRGPGTIVVVDNIDGPENGTLLTTDISNPVILANTMLLGADHSSYRGTGYKFFSSFQCPSSQYPIGDMRQNASAVAQCRVPCENFDFSPYEVLRIWDGCGFANSTEAERWFSIGLNGNPQLCIPREICIDRCGTEGFGCVYSGSCVSRHCLSGVDSKQPAIFTNLLDDGSISEVFVNNSGPVVDADPPYYKYEDSLEGNATAVPREGLFTEKPSQPNSPTPKPGSSSPSSEENKQNNSPKSKWLWLGPTVGAVFLGLVIIVVILILLFRRTKQLRYPQRATYPAWTLQPNTNGIPSTPP